MRRKGGDNAANAAIARQAFRRRAIGGAALLLLGTLLSACSGGGHDKSGSASSPARESFARPETPSGGGAGDAGSSTEPSSSQADATAPSVGASPSAPRTAEPDAPETSQAVLIAAGDIMVHSQQLPAYYNSASGKYDFDSWFREVTPILSSGDWVIGNLETPLGGADLKYTGYPRFNAPPELAATLKKAGFQLLSTANNHTLDRGYVGAARTLAHLRAAGLVPVGTSVSKTDAKRLVIEERNGIKLGFLAYTYGTNGIPIPENHPYVVNLIDSGRIAADIGALREAGADSVVVSLHFGTEYQRMPSDSQRQIATEAIAAGADVVIGSHPHVVQPYETVEVSDPSRPDGKRQGIVLYSLGNFISAQKGDWKDVGVIFKLTATKVTDTDGSSVVRWGETEATPTWVHTRTVNKKQYFTILPLAQTISERDDPSLGDKDYDDLATLLNGLNRHLRRLTAASAG